MVPCFGNDKDRQAEITLGVAEVAVICEYTGL